VSSALNENNQDRQLDIHELKRVLTKYSSFEREYSIGLLVIHSVRVVRDIPRTRCGLGLSRDFNQ
jgi:hypothetical protein